MSTGVNVEQFDNRGKYVRDGQIAISRMENVVYMHVTIGARSVNIAMPRSAWESLNCEVTGLSANERAVEERKLRELQQEMRDAE